MHIHQGFEGVVISLGPSRRIKRRRREKKIHKDGIGVSYVTLINITESSFKQLFSLLHDLFIVIYFVPVFKAEPPLPPSVSQVVQREAESRENFFQSMRRLLTNFGYLLLLLSYGINVGVFYAISTLLNSIIQKHFPVSPTFFRVKILVKLNVLFILRFICQAQKRRRRENRFDDRVRWNVGIGPVRYDS